MQTSKAGTYVHSQDRIEIGKRFVEKQDPWFRNHRPCHRRPLLLPATQLSRIPIGEQLQIYHLQRAVNTFSNFVPGYTAYLQSERNILKNGQMGIKAVILKDETDPTLLGRNISSITIGKDAQIIKIDVPVRRLFETCNTAEERGLSTSGRSEQNEKLPAPYLDIQIPKGGNAIKPL